MTISMYSASIPVCIRMLKNLVGILEKGAGHCRENDIDESVMVGARLFPDMFPLARQVQIASDIVAGLEPDAVEDNEKTFDELIERVRNVIAFLDTLEPEQIEGSEDRPITFRLRGADVTMAGQVFLLNFVMPNVYFHITTAYDILRHNGVVLGKPDYLGRF
ncbi:MAG: hypothetical protein AMJ59_25330 [Gammaproteobacteria bacterium SG8_31]|nr:MAG: hypothetical protein AMJ59_25330 [Gammaproteobacteria bacterium SG8_31]